MTAEKFAIEPQAFPGIPRRAPSIIITPRQGPDGQPVALLKDPSANKYFRLTPQGLFIWNKLDGARGLRELTREYFTVFQAFAPEVIVETVQGLADCGFVKFGPPGYTLEFSLSKKPLWAMRLERALGFMNWQVNFYNVDGLITRLQKLGLGIWCGKVGWTIGALVSIAGGICYVAHWHENSTHFSAAIFQDPAVWIMLVALFLLSVLLHEAGHALQLKSFGYEIPRAGFGWHWFKPVAFVDTSEMWIATRWQRASVSAAGPFVNLFLGGISSLALVFINLEIHIAAVLWSFSAISYLFAIVNLLPFFPITDGHHLFSDLAAKPGLAVHCWRWLWRTLPRIVKSPRQLLNYKVELIYWGAAFILGVIVLALGIPGCLAILSR